MAPYDINGFSQSRYEDQGVREGLKTVRGTCPSQINGKGTCTRRPENIDGITCLIPVSLRHTEDSSIF